MKTKIMRTSPGGFCKSYGRGRIAASFAGAGTRVAATAVLALLVWVPCSAQTSDPSTSPTTAASSCKVLDPELAQGIYSGECRGGLAHGAALVQVKNPAGVVIASYQGEFVAGRKEGMGRKTYTNGDVYEGQWHQDQRHGHGFYAYGSTSPWVGDRYEGAWRDDLMQGYGRYIWASGDTYAGAWNKGEPTNKITPVQARRALYLKNFQKNIADTSGQVCGQTFSPFKGLRGVVKGANADRIFVEQAGGKSAWHMVSFWYPCRF